MADHPNVAFVRRAVDAFSTGDLGTLEELLAPDVVVHVPGRSQLAGDHRGRDALFAYNGQMMELAENTYENTIHDILANDEHAVILQHNTASRSGRTLDVDEVLVMHMRDGQIVEVWEVYADQYAFDDFWF